MTDKTIICLANNYFFDPTSKHHVMRELAKTNHVLWINWHASRRPSLTRRDFSSVLDKLKQCSHGVTKVQKRLWVLTPLVLPLPSSPLAQRLNRWLVAQQTKQVLRQLPPQRQLWSFTPDIVPLLGSFNEELVVYYCVDEFAAFSGYDVEATRRYDRDLCRMADLVITTSQSLFAAKRVYNPCTVQVPHGVLFNHFVRAVEPDFPVADDLRNLPRPIIGYYGLIQDWQDLDLLAAIAQRRPNWSVVLVGKIQTDIQRFRSIRNLHFCGQRPHDQLPHYSRGFDVAVIPHKINELTLNMNPIKLREYLAAGLPVVASALPEVRAYEPHVRVATTVEEWLAALEKAIADRNVEADGKRSQRVAGEDWSQRVKEITTHLQHVQLSLAENKEARRARTQTWRNRFKAPNASATELQLES